ncbi:MAG: transglycosylase [Roseburia sp.]
MKKEEMTIVDIILEAVGILGLLFYLGFQIYYGIQYGIPVLNILVNVLIMLLVYVLLTWLQFFPERVNAIPKERCVGDVKRYTIEMLRTVKLIFTLCLLFTSVCDILGNQINSGYSVVVVIAIIVVAVYYEIKIIRILRNQNKKQ